MNQQTQESTSAPQQAQQPANPDLSALVQDGKILGKYPDAQSATQGFWQLNNYAAQQAEMNKQLQAQLAAYQQPAQPQEDDPIEALATEALIPRDKFMAAVEKVASQIVERKFAPIEKAYAARETLASQFSDYETNEKALGNWLNTNPDLQTRVQALQKAGFVEESLRLAYREFQASKGASGAPTPQQLAAASMPNTQAQGQRGGAPVEQNPDRLRSALQYARQYGDPGPAYSEIFKGFQWYGSPEETQS